VTVANTLIAATLLTVVGSTAWAQAPREDLSQGDGRVSDFYVWTQPLPAQPGQMLRTEPLPTTLGLTNAGRQIRILYSATDGVAGKGIVPVSGALFLPKGEAPKGGWPIVAWAHGTVGVADICAPSWAGRSYRDVRYLNTWLAQGYAVVATDYQGLGVPGPHPYLNARPEAYSVLDSIRAALKAEPTLANKVVVVGQSQGAGAAFSTAAVAPDYAPDVHLLGTVATGIPNFSPKSMAAAASSGGPSDAATKITPAIAYSFYVTLMGQQTNKSLDPATIFTEAALPVLDQARIECIFSLEEDVIQTKLTPDGSYKPGFLKALFGPVMPALMYPTLKLKMPIFIGTGGKDVDAPAPSQQALVKDVCQAGSTVEFHFYPDEDHPGAVNASLKDSLPFVRKALAGETINSNCGSQP